MAFVNRVFREMGGIAEQLISDRDCDVIAEREPAFRIDFPFAEVTFFEEVIRLDENKPLREFFAESLDELLFFPFF